MRTLFRWVGEKPPTRYAIPPDLIYDEAGNYLWLCLQDSYSHGARRGPVTDEEETGEEETSS